MNRMLMVATLLMGSSLAATGSPLVLCGQGKTTPCMTLATSISDMAGVWRQPLSTGDLTVVGRMGYSRFTSDGTFALVDSLEHAAAPASFSPFPHGTYSFEGSRMTINVVNPAPGMPECTRVQEVWIVTLGDQRVAMTFTPVADTCKSSLNDTGQAQLYVGPAPGISDLPRKDFFAF